eukprot:gene11494-24031_t
MWQCPGSVRIISRIFGSVLYSRRQSSLPYCIDLVKKNDFDSYLSGLLLPCTFRGVFFALKAFNVEIALIKQNTIANRLAGRIRFQWWRDTLEDIFNTSNSSSIVKYHNQPVVQAIRMFVDKYDLSRHWFENCLEARASDLLQPQKDTLSDLESYCEQSHSSLHYLLLEAMSIKHEHAEFAASHVGVCSGLVTILRGTAFHASHGDVYLPEELLLKNNLTADLVLRIAREREREREGQTSSSSLPSQMTLEHKKALAEVVYDIASQAHAHLDKAREIQREHQLPSNAIFALLPAIRASLYLEQLRRVDFDPFSPALAAQQQHFLRLQLHLMYSRFTRKI